MRKHDDLHRCLRAVKRFRIIVVAVIIEVQRNVGILYAERFFRIRDSRCYIARAAVCKVLRYAKAFRFKAFSFFIQGLYGLREHFERNDAASERHHVARIVFEIQRTVFIHNGTAKRILPLCAARCKQDFRPCDRLAVIDRQRFLLPRRVPDHAQVAWRHVF